MANKEIIVQLASPERYYTKCYHDFIDSTLLNGEEKIIFLALKRFLDVKSDNGNVFPTIETIQKMTGWGNQKVVKYIKSLVKKGIVKKIRQGLSKPNIYVLSDDLELWKAGNGEELKAAIDEIEEKRMIEALTAKGYYISKEKGLESAKPTKVTAESSTINNNIDIDKDSTKGTKSQLERYTLDQIKQLFDYDIMIQDNPYRQKDIDSVMNILHTAMNTTKATIRIAGENKPSMAVIGKLMKLNNESIMYAIEKYQEQTERIKNPTSYMLTILYNAPEQFNLDIHNRVSYDTVHLTERDKQ